MRPRLPSAPLGAPPLRPAPIPPALAPAVPGSSSHGNLPYLNTITCIKNTESWRADSVCLNIYPCSDQALCSHDSAISTWHIYGLPGCRAPHAACPGATDPPCCAPSVAPCAPSGDPWAGSHLQPGTSLLGCAGAARISRAGHGRSGYHICPPQHRSCSATRCREGAQGTACSPKTGSCSFSQSDWVPADTAMGMAQGCSSSVLPCDLPLLRPRALGTARPAARGGPGAAAPAPRGSVSGGIRAVSGKGLSRSRRRGEAQRGSPRCHRSGITNKTLAIS